MEYKPSWWIHVLEKLQGDNEPFLCNTAPNPPKGSYKCANLITSYSFILLIISCVVICVARRKRAKQSDEMVNLFGVSIFSVRLYKLIIWGEVLNIIIMLWHPLMMYL